MGMRDSGFIDLFAIHEAGARATPPPPPSAPPPAVSFDTGEADMDVLVRAREQSRLYAKIAGGVVGALAVLGVLALAVGASSTKPEASVAITAAVVAPPPAPTFVPPVRTAVAPAVAAPPTETQAPAPPPTARAKSEVAPSVAATAAAPAKAKRKAPAAAKKAKFPAVKLQKVQSSGT